MATREHPSTRDVLENQYWMGLSWREAFVVPFVSGSVPAWSDGLGNPIEWDSAPRFDGDRGWCIVISHATDPDGWVYGTHFDRLQYDRSGGRASKRAGDGIRSRLWRRLHMQQELGSASGDATVGSRPGLAASTAQAVSSLGSTLGRGAQAASQKATIGGLWVTVVELLRDAAARHQLHNLVTLDLSGWWVVLGEHDRTIKRQQLGQLRNLVWFSADAEALAGASSGGRQPGPAAAGGGGGGGGGNDGDDATPLPAAPREAKARHVAGAGAGTRARELPGRPTAVATLQIGGGGGAAAEAPETGGGGGGGGAALALTVCPLAFLEEVRDAVRFSRAAYGYVVAAGHLKSVTNALKLIATIGMFDPIGGVSMQANTQALLSMSGFSQEDIVMVEWSNTTFRPCHYLAVDRKQRRLVLAVRGSLELGDIVTDLTAAPLDFELGGIRGKVHQGLMSAATYVHCNTADALAEAAAAHPGWPLLVTGHSLGGGVAALLTLLLQLPGGAPQEVSHVRCVCVGPAAVLSRDLAEACEGHITSVVLGSDPVPRLSLYSVERLLLHLVNASISRRAAKTLEETTARTLSAINAGLARMAGAGAALPITPTIEMASLLFSGGAEGLKALPEMMASGARYTRLDGGDADGYASGSGSDDPEGVDWGALRSYYSNKWWGLDGLPSDSTPTDSAGGPSMAAAAGSVGCSPPGGGGLSGPVSHALDASADSMDGAGCDAAAGGGNASSEAPSARAPPAAAAGSPSPSPGPSGGGVTKRPGRAVARTGAAAGDGGATAGARDEAAAGAEAAAMVRAASSSSLSDLGGGARRGPKPGAARQVRGSDSFSAIFPRFDEQAVVSAVHDACTALGGSSPPGGASPARSHAAHAAPGAAAQGVVAPAPPPGEPGAGGGGLVRSGVTWDPAGGAAGAAARQAVTWASSITSWPLTAANHVRSRLAAGQIPPTRSRSEADVLLHVAEGAAGEGGGAAAARSAPSSPDRRARLGAAEAAAGDDVDSTVSALERGLQSVVHLYPPGRVLWILSDDLVGPAAQQLVQSVVGHLPGGGGGGGGGAPAPATPPSSAASAAGSAAAAARAADAPPAPTPAPPSTTLVAPLPDRMHSGTHLQARAEARVNQPAAEGAPLTQAKRVLDSATTPASQDAAASALEAARRRGTHAATVDAGGGAIGPRPSAEAGDAAKRKRTSAAPPPPPPPQQQQQIQLSGAGSRCMEVDGEGAPPGVDLPLEELYPELRELLDLLGEPTDASSAIATAHKRQLLLQHFQQQRRNEALAVPRQRERAAAAAAAAAVVMAGHAGRAASSPPPPRAVVELVSPASFGRGSFSADGAPLATADDPPEASASQCGRPAAPAASARAADGAVQQLQLSSFRESPELLEWQRRQEAELEAQAQQRAARQGGGGNGDGQPMGAVQQQQQQQQQPPQSEQQPSIELADVTQRLSQGLSSLQVGPGSCAPVLAPVAGKDTPAGQQEGGGRRPVVVAAEREVFSELLLHKNGVQDHIPDMYFDAVEALFRAYGGPQR